MFRCENMKFRLVFWFLFDKFFFIFHKNSDNQKLKAWSFWQRKNNFCVLNNEQRKNNFCVLNNEHDRALPSLVIFYMPSLLCIHIITASSVIVLCTNKTYYQIMLKSGGQVFSQAMVKLKFHNKMCLKTHTDHPLNRPQRSVNFDIFCYFHASASRKKNRWGKGKSWANVASVGGNCRKSTIINYLAT